MKSDSAYHATCVSCADQQEPTNSFQQAEENCTRSPQVLRCLSKAIRYQGQVAPRQATRRKGPAQEDAQGARRTKRQVQGRWSRAGGCLAGVSFGPRESAGCQGLVDEYQGATKGQGGKVLGSFAEGPRNFRGGNVQGFEDWTEEAEGMEANGQQGHVCWRGIHPKAREDGTIHPTDGYAIQEGQRDTSGLKGNFPAADHWRQEEPAISAIHAVGCIDEGYRYRGQRCRIGYGYYGW